MCGVGVGRQVRGAGRVRVRVCGGGAGGGGGGGGGAGGGGGGRRPPRSLAGARGAAPALQRDLERRQRRLRLAHGDGGAAVVLGDA